MVVTRLSKGIKVGSVGATVVNFWMKRVVNTTVSTVTVVTVGGVGHRATVGVGLKVGNTVG